VQLKKVEAIHFQSIQRVFQAFPGADLTALVGLAAEEELFPVSFKPGAEVFLRVAVEWRDIDVINAVFQCHLQGGIGGFLADAEKGKAPENKDAAHMLRFA
jgi:hypothetical protein